MNSLTAFGPDFLWGVATSAYQIEGAATEDGRAPSIWDTFCRVAGAIDSGHTGDLACDHYHRWQEDVELLTKLGVNAYRLSISWSRVIPEGSGWINPAGMAFYDRLIDALLEAGIRPFVTLYHWDLPQALQDRGGWPVRTTAQEFADYAAVMASALGDRVSDWMTLNEPLCSAWIGHLEGRMAPGWTDILSAVKAAHHLLLGHGLATAAIRAYAALPPSIGIVNNLSPCEPVSVRDEDLAATARADGHTNRWWLDPVHGRGYPADMVAIYGVEPPIKDGDLDVIASPLDWLGLNYYFRMVVAADPHGPTPRYRAMRVPDATETATGWEVHPAGLEQLLLRLTHEYQAKKIYVTENGSAWPDVPDLDGTVDDKQRVVYLEQHLEACARAVRQGVPLCGYFAWSLMDNFEWAHGYSKRFGLVYVDYDSQARIIKSSGYHYADIIRAHKAVSMLAS